MDKGVWVWPADPRGQKRVLQAMVDSPHVLAALQAISKSKDGLSNSELDDALTDNANWITVWAVRQLLALNFIEERVDFFGGPVKYVATELGRSALAAVTDQPAQPRPTPPTQPAPAKAA
jgi:hypothetical protein